jgi:diaminopimelate decarboxylase
MQDTPEWPAWDPHRWETLAAEYSTPLYLFDAEFVRRRVQLVKTALGGLAGVYYAVKANPNLALLRAVHDTVDGADISSGGELHQALAAGFAGEQMSFAGPAKTDDELRPSPRAWVASASSRCARSMLAPASRPTCKHRRGSSFASTRPKCIARTVSRWAAARCSSA